MYIVTFHTHYGAMTFLDRAKKKDPSSQMRPVPRVLSAACGVCVSYDSDMTDVVIADIPENMDTLYLYNGNSYEALFENPDA